MAINSPGTFTLTEVLLFTDQFVPNRFDFKERDVVRRIIVKEVREVDVHHLPGSPRSNTKYVIQSKSWPQYYPYYRGRDSRGRTIAYQRTVAHMYDITLEMDRLSLNTRNWRMRLGSGKVWNLHPPQSQIKQIYRENRVRWDSKRQARHRATAPYLDVGDWNAQAQGINADFIFRQSFARWRHGHLFGRNYFGNVPAVVRNPDDIIFLTKHEINCVEMLMEKGVLKNN